MDRVVLLPGWGTDPNRLSPLASALRSDGLRTHVWTYTPQGSIAGLASRLAHDVGGDAGMVHLVGHSLGGVVVTRAALGPLADRVLTVTTINAPFRGTWASYTGDTPLSRELRWGSPVLDELRADLADHLAEDEGPQWLALSAAGDLVATAATALATGVRGERFRRRVVAANGHSRSLASPRTIAQVRAHVGATVTTG